MKKLLGSAPIATDLALLILRLGFGLLLAFDHGLPKLRHPEGDFVDFLGLGTKISMGLCIFGEFFCSLLVAAGLFTRLFLVPLIITMSVAVFQAHAHDPLAKKEHALLYLIVFVVLFLTGPGKCSLDAWIRKK